MQARSEGGSMGRLADSDSAKSGVNAGWHDADHIRVKVKTQVHCTAQAAMFDCLFCM